MIVINYYSILLFIWSYRYINALRNENVNFDVLPLCVNEDNIMILQRG